MRGALLIAVMLLPLAALPIQAGTNTECVLVDSLTPVAVSEPITCSFTCDVDNGFRLYAEASTTGGTMHTDCGTAGFGVLFLPVCVADHLNPMPRCTFSVMAEPGGSSHGTCVFTPRGLPTPTLVHEARCGAVAA